MRFKHMMAAVALAFPGLMAAVPADPRPRTLVNPDGTEITVRVHGNEFFHFMTDEACTRILERDSRGFISDMVRDGAPVAFTRENVGMLTEEAMSRYSSETRSSVSSMKRMGALNEEGRSDYPTVGKGNRSLVVLVEFEDVSFTVPDPKDYFTRQLNEPGFSDYGGSGSALDYYIAASNGKYVPQFDVYGPVKVSYPASYFHDDKGSGAAHMNVLIKDALTQLRDSGEVNFSNYDLDADDVVDTVFFYYAGYGSADSETETIWPHQFDYKYLNSGFGANVLRFDGKRIGPYACGNELKGWNPRTGKQPWKDGSEPWVDGIGTFVHEYGHVLGLPDLYDTNYTPGVTVDTPGILSVMAEGPYNLDGCVPPLYSAYEQWLCRWLEFTEAEDMTSYRLPALGSAESPKAVRIGIPKDADGSAIENEYFVIEARDNSGWDRSLPESGIYIWRINYDKKTWVGNQVNSANGSNVVVHYADGPKNPAFTSGFIYPGSPAELIPSKDYEFWKSPIISDISYDAKSKTGAFDYNMIGNAPEDATLLHDVPLADESGARNFTLQWDPVEGATSYRVTIKRSSNGDVLGVYDEYDVGNVTSLTVTSVPMAYWFNEVEAYVRVVKSIPSSRVSNVVRFTPKNLPMGNAVDGIEAEQAVISGGVGCIIAPEGAVVVDMAGKRLSKEGLAPGVYIVVYGPRTEKVLVH